MSEVSARSTVGLPILDQNDHVVGTAETWLISPETRSIEGLLIGRPGEKGQDFVPLLCVDDIAPEFLRVIDRATDSRPQLQRIIGLPTWTTSPKFLVGFVHDCLFDRATGKVTTFIVHQIVRRWDVPAALVVEITPKALLLERDSTAKLKLTPYPLS